MRCGFKDIRFNSTVAEPSGFNSLGNRSHISLVVQWLGYMTLTHEIRVQFPARDPCFRQPSTPLFYASWLSVKALWHS